MRVSVVVPLFNKAKYITRALQSIADQSCEDFEAIVIDDGSTDGGDAIAAAFSDRRFRVIRQPNAGPGAARNAGAAVAKAEILAFLDADDTWLPEYLQTGLETLARLPQIAAVTSTYFIQPANRSTEDFWRRRGLAPGVFSVTPKISDKQLAHVVAFMSPSTTIFRRSAFERYGGFYAVDKCKYAEDAQLCLKILLNLPVALCLDPHVNRDFGASELCRNLVGSRPVEPFLLDPDDAANVCPAELRPLLRRYYARCACKTAMVMASWGQAATARSLVRRYVRLNNASPAFFGMGLLACMPFAGILGPIGLQAAIAARQRGRLSWV